MTESPIGDVTHKSRIVEMSDGRGLALFEYKMSTTRRNSRLLVSWGYCILSRNQQPFWAYNEKGDSWSWGSNVFFPCKRVACLLLFTHIYHFVLAWTVGWLQFKDQWYRLYGFSSILRHMRNDAGAVPRKNHIMLSIAVASEHTNAIFSQRTQLRTD